MGTTDRRNGTDRRSEQRETVGRRLVDRIAANVETVAWLLDIPAWEFAWVADRRRAVAARIAAENVALNSEFR